MLTDDWTPTSPWTVGTPSDDPISVLYRALHTDAGPDGFFDRIGGTHAAQFTDGADVLLVAFEQTETLLRASRGGKPIARGVQNRTDIAQLTLLAEDETWFRAPEVYAFFDDLIDDGFFDGFERVIFYGAGAQGYAAAAYSVAAPRADVVLIQPQASLTPSIAGWDDRFPALRRTDFTSRYGYAPQMMETAARGFVIVDPAEREDFMHACLFARENVDIIRQRFLGPEAEPHLDAAGLIDKLLDLVVAGDATVAEIAQTLRPRRKLYPHMNRVLSVVEASENDWRIARVARAATTQKDHPRFAAALDTAQAALAAEGRALPNAEATASPTEQSGPSAAAAVLAVGGALGGLASDQPDSEAPPDVPSPQEDLGPELAPEADAIVESNDPLSVAQEAELSALVRQIPDPTPRDVQTVEPVKIPEDLNPEMPEDMPALAKHDPAAQETSEKLPFPTDFLVRSVAGPISAWPGPASVSLRDHQHPNGGQAAVAMSPARMTTAVPEPSRDKALNSKSDTGHVHTPKNRPKSALRTQAKSLRKSRPGKRRL